MSDAPPPEATPDPPSRVVLSTRFAIVPEWIIFHPSLTGNDVQVYAALARFADYQTRDCYPSAAAIGEKIGRSERRVRDSLTALAGTGAIHVRRRRTTSIYTLAGDQPLTDESVRSRQVESDRAQTVESDRARADETDLQTRTSDLEPLNETPSPPTASKRDLAKGLVDGYWEWVKVQSGHAPAIAYMGIVKIVERFVESYDTPAVKRALVEMWKRGETLTVQALERELQGRGRRGNLRSVAPPVAGWDRDEPSGVISV